MSSESRTNLRAVGVWAGCALLIVVAVFWWSAWDQPGGAPELQENSLPVGSNPDGENVASVRITEPTPPSADEDSSSNPVTAEEIRKVRGELSAARKLLHEIEAKYVKSLPATDDETDHTEQVFLPALTREQLDPVHIQLSKAVREFPEGSGGAQMFRQEADKFLTKLAKLPARHVNHIVNKRTGQSSYGRMQLSEDTTVSMGAHGALEIRGSGVSQFETVKPEEVRHLFRDESK